MLLLCLLVSVFFRKSEPLAALRKRTFPVVYSMPVDHSKPVIIQTTAMAFSSRSGRTMKLKAREIIVVRKAIRQPEPPPVAPAPLPVDMLNSFVSAVADVPDFTMTVPELPTAVEPVTFGSPVPYVPSVTFYRSDTESLQIAGKKTIHL